MSSKLNKLYNFFFAFIIFFMSLVIIKNSDKGDVLYANVEDCYYLNEVPTENEFNYFFTENNRIKQLKRAKRCFNKITTLEVDKTLEDRCFKKALNKVSFFIENSQKHLNKDVSVYWDKNTFFDFGFYYTKKDKTFVSKDYTDSIIYYPYTISLEKGLTGKDLIKMDHFFTTMIYGNCVASKAIF